MKMILSPVYWLILILLYGFAFPLAAKRPPDADTLRQWIVEMKTTAKGPFRRIRWFCKDGSVLPPKAYACSKHGGGIQHGEWNQKTKQIRAAGYWVGTVMAGLSFKDFTRAPEYRDHYNQMLLEQFLIRADDGWIWRKARYYRGALQQEDETKGARTLLQGLLQNPNWLRYSYAPLRIGGRLLSHGKDTPSVLEVRRLSATLSDKDPAFKPLRNKIHGSPDQKDAKRVRQYATKVKNPKEYQRLAAAIEALYQSHILPQEINQLAQRLGRKNNVAKELKTASQALTANNNATLWFTTTAQLLARLREALPKIRQVNTRLDALDLSLALELAHFSAANRLRTKLPNASRRTRLAWLTLSAKAVYGSGLMSPREWQAWQDSFQRLHNGPITLGPYKRTLDYFARLPGWSSQELRFHFFRSMRKFATIEPLAALFIQDQLRGSPLLFYSELLDGLLQDANRLAGVHHQLFGQTLGSGLRALNPGLARGTLRLANGQNKKREDFHRDGIYLLAETISELPPVAGILTAGEGNPLSHIQLLARNLGIPNVGVDQALLSQLRPYEGKKVILAVSPAGSVQLIEDHGEGNQLFGKTGQPEQILIRPDLLKLDLSVRTFIPLSQLRATDSGRTVGPKAAKLGELYHHYPKAVADGLTIPFGFFRTLLEQPMPGENTSVYRWMVGRYQALAKMPEGSPARLQATEVFRQRLQHWILTADPGADFRKRLTRAMTNVFGREGRYGVFVRSDTNVEDLPGFTGAGLNLTVPNVVGIKALLQAIPKVWASPFSSRAFAWRQAHMDQPQHVYPAILLLRSVPAEKSGVMVTRDIDNGQTGWLSVAINEGIGGAVDGQAAESLRIHLASGRVRLLARATAPLRRQLAKRGGITKVPVRRQKAVLQPQEIQQLITFTKELSTRFPSIVDAQGQPAPADIEFGFLEGRLKLFQIRPFLESRQARNSTYLNKLDQNLRQDHMPIDLNIIPGES